MILKTFLFPDNHFGFNNALFEASENVIICKCHKKTNKFTDIFIECNLIIAYNYKI